MKAVGLILVIFGVILTLTCWAAIIGIPMIIVGAGLLCSK